jgi:hypothetical protein
MGAVPGQHVELMKTARVEQVIDALTGQQFAFCVLTLNRSLRSGIAGSLLTVEEVVEPFFHC